MTVYKLTVNLDATLAVQNSNGSFHFFKPSIGAEFTTDETDDLTVLNKKFEDLYSEVIGPNFNSVVKEFLINPKNEEKTEGQLKKVCNCDDGSCSCKPLEIVAKPELSTDDSEEDFLAEGNAAELENKKDLPKEEWE